MLKPLLKASLLTLISSRSMARTERRRSPDFSARAHSLLATDREFRELTHRWFLGDYDLTNYRV